MSNYIPDPEKRSRTKYLKSIKNIYREFNKSRGLERDLVYINFDNKNIAFSFIIFNVSYPINHKCFNSGSVRR